MLLFSIGFGCSAADVTSVGALPDYGPDVPATFVWPLSGSEAPDWTAGAFSPRWKISEQRYDFHQGLDLVPRANAGGPVDQDTLAEAPPLVHAVADGVVDGLYPVGSTAFANSGNVVRLRHHIDGASDAPENVYYTYYMHLHDLCDDDGDCLVEEQQVARGQGIAHLGATATTTEDLDFRHLHFEVRGHRWQFYAMNPMRYLPRADSVDYAPLIVTGEDQPQGCAAPADPLAPSFLLRLSASRDELDVDRVRVWLTDLDRGEVIAEDEVGFEAREGLAYWHDIDGDGEIRITGTYGEDEPSTFEYDADALLGASTPVFEGCGGAVRNVFGSTADAYTLELRYADLPGAEHLRIEAEVCDLYGSCAAAEPVELGASG